jgi:ubiquinone/menaquinone biosynthesis C-methylase UbiE
MAEAFFFIQNNVQKFRTIMSEGNNDYYTGFQKNVAATHNWRTIKTCLPFMIKYVQNSKSLKILDVGCGPGSITHDLYNNYGHYNDILGVDTPKDLIRSCKNKYCDGKNKIFNSNYSNTLSFEQASIYDLPYEDNTFDIVYCSQVLVHLKSPVKAVCELKRVLKKSPGPNNHSYLFICEAEMRSVLIHPLKYQDIFTKYFQAISMTYTKSSFGLSLKEVFQSSENFDSGDKKPYESTLDIFPWCISDELARKHFASMYIARIADCSDITEANIYIDAWNNWADESTGVLALINGVLTVVY